MILVVFPLGTAPCVLLPGSARSPRRWLRRPLLTVPPFTATPAGPRSAAALSPAGTPALPPVKGRSSALRPRTAGTEASSRPPAAARAAPRATGCRVQPCPRGRVSPPSPPVSLPVCPWAWAALPGPAPSWGSSGPPRARRGEGKGAAAPGRRHDTAPLRGRGAQRHFRIRGGVLARCAPRGLYGERLGCGAGGAAPLAGRAPPGLPASLPPPRPGLAPSAVSASAPAASCPARGASRGAAAMSVAERPEEGAAAAASPGRLLGT